MPSSALEFVRLGVLPSIRPPGADQTASVDSPEEGVTAITGNGGGVIDLTFSVSHSLTRALHEEVERKYDIVRTYYTRQDGSIDWTKWVEWEVLREVSFGNGDKERYGEVVIGINMELMQSGLWRASTT